jgi:hypothetical protein
MKVLTVIYKIIKWNESMMGNDVSIITKESAKQRGFEVNKVYNGRLQDKRDWMIGCPVFECETGILGLNYECELIQEIKNEVNL